MNDRLPFNSIEVLRESLLFSVLGIFAYLAAIINYKTSGEVPKWRFIAHALFFVGFYFGVTWMLKFVNPTAEGTAYQLAIKTSIFRIAHFVAPTVPLILLLTAFFVDSRMKASAAKQDY